MVEYPRCRALGSGGISSVRVGWVLLLFCVVACFGIVARAKEHSERPRLLKNIRRLTFVGERAGEGYFSSDGTKLVFQSEREPGNPFYQIYLMNLVTGRVKRISPGRGKATCAWIHPSGHKVLFASTHLDPESLRLQREEYERRKRGDKRRYTWDFDEHYDIFVAELSDNDEETVGLRRLTFARGYDAEASWSPDGKWVLFASNRHAYTDNLSQEESKLFEKDPSSQVDIYLMSAERPGRVMRLTRALGYDGGPFFNTQGTKICWRRFTPDGMKAEIWTMNPDGTDKRQITSLGVMSWAPFFHPSGDYLIFTSSVQGFSNFELYIVDTEGHSKPVRVTYSSGFDGLPVFSPSGDELFWTSSRNPEGKPQIYRASWDDALARRLLGLQPKRAKLTVKDIPGKPLEPRSLFSEQELRRHAGFLASPGLQGRYTGTEGELEAARYIAARFKEYGLVPVVGLDYLQKFPFTAGVTLGNNNRLYYMREGDSVRHDVKLGQDWLPLAFSATGNFVGSPVIFAGYGITAPQEDELPEYDSYAGLDVKGKWVMVFRYYPEHLPRKQREHLQRYAGLRRKAMIAREKGAVGLIIVSGPNSRVRNQLVPMEGDASLAGSSLAVVSVTDKIAQDLLRSGGRYYTLKKLQDRLDQGDNLQGFLLPALRVGARVDLVQEKREGRNVLGRLAASGSASDEVVVVGAHLDHLGYGGHSSLARAGEQGMVHPGADDNASGVSAMLELARVLSRKVNSGELRLSKDIIFAAWSGEELGALGSSYFVKHYIGKSGVGSGALQGTKIVAYVNFDMVGRLKDKLIVQGTGTGDLWATLLERACLSSSLPVVTQRQGLLSTDTNPFYLHKIPVLGFFTGAHQDYHTPRDTPDKLLYGAMVRICSLSYRIIADLATSRDVVHFREVGGHRGNKSARRPGRRVYLGTIPDYSNTEVTGVRLSGVVEGGPAQKAGLRGGDIVVGLAGHKITNIYDYTYALEELEIGKPVSIIVLRDGEQVRLTIIPASRD